MSNKQTRDNSDVVGQGTRPRYCAACTNVVEDFLDGSPEGGHSTTKSGLQAAQNAGCLVCQTIVKEYTKVTVGESDPLKLWIRWFVNSRFNSEEELTIVITLHLGSVRLAEAYLKMPRFDLSINAGSLEPYHVPAHSSDRRAHVLARTWLERCLTRHPSCGKECNPDYQPPRLLCLMTESIRLISTTSQLVTGSYATLSHCWGPNPSFVTLTAGNLAAFQVRIDIAKLPKTFRDAILFCRNIGIQYLWIDSLCIIQSGDGSEVDWLQHVSLMPQIYRNAILNVSADWASSSQHGLFHTRNPVKKIKYKSQALQHSLAAAPLQKRGWVLQERVMSPRIIHFAQDQLHWECAQSLSVCEDTPMGVPFGQDCEEAKFDLCSLDHWTILRGKSSRNNRNEVETIPTSVLRRSRPLNNENVQLQKFCELVEEYSIRRLTHVNTDIFPAFGAIAEHFAKNLDSRYIAGFLECHLPSLLAWKVMDEPRALEPHQGGSIYRCPSWSWAKSDCSVHMTGALLYTRNRYSTYRPIAQLRSAHLMLKDPFNLHGQLTAAHIELSAPLMHCHWETNVSINQDVTQLYLTSAGFEIRVYLAGFVFDSSAELHGTQGDTRLALIDAILIERSGKSSLVFAIILRQTIREQDVVYRRIGAGRFPVGKDDDDWRSLVSIVPEDIVLI